MADAAPTQTPEDEALRTDREAAAKLDQVEAPPAKVTKMHRRGPKPPTGLGEDVAEFGVRLRLVSIGKPIANVQITMTFDLDRPQPEIGSLMGQHAYSAVFKGGFLGEGVEIKEAPRKVDADKRVVESLKVTMPRLDSSGKDQIDRCILPLIHPEPAALLTALLQIDGSWRLNIPTEIEGVLRLHTMQETIEGMLTKRATTEAEDKAAAKLDEADTATL